MSAAPDDRDAAPTRAVELAAFFRAHHGFVWRIARRLGAPAPAIDDIVQDVFLAVGRDPERFEGRSSIKTWLFGITANIVKMHHRGEARRRHREAAAAGLAVAEPACDAAERHAAVDLLDRLIGKLDAEKRAVFVLIELEDADPKEVARAFGVSVNTVHSRLRLARERLASEVRRIKARQERER